LVRSEQCFEVIEFVVQESPQPQMQFAGGNVGLGLGVGDDLQDRGRSNAGAVGARADTGERGASHGCALPFSDFRVLGLSPERLGPPPPGSADLPRAVRRPDRERLRRARGRFRLQAPDSVNEQQQNVRMTASNSRQGSNRSA
jgi:hypothetical protein